MADISGSKRDFFVSFNQVDRVWATWIAWVLEEDGYAVWFQDWDFRGNFVEHMHRAHREAERTLAVLSDHYFGSDFTLAEWSARFAQDPAARRDRLVPVKVGPLTGEGILAPIVYADLTGCDEAEAQRRLLERVRKALDPSHRSKPVNRPGFPGGGPAREVPDKPLFPVAEAKSASNRGTEGAVVTGSRSVYIGRDATGSSIVTGDSNVVTSTYTATQLPPAESVDMGVELKALRALLTALRTDNAPKIGRALDDAKDELDKPAPDKDEVGGAVERAVKYAKGAGDFADQAAKLAPHLAAACAWLGSNWHGLLAIAGIAA